MTIEELYPRNTICEGDNLEYLRSFPDNSFDMIYADPPFNSKKSYTTRSNINEDSVAFTDLWTWSELSEEILLELRQEYPNLAQFLSVVDIGHSRGMKAYCVMMAVRLIEMERVLKDTGTIYIHCDRVAMTYLKVIMDFIFKSKNFRNQIVWKRTTGPKMSTRNLPNNYDYILRYTKSNKFIWNLDYMYLPPDKNYLKRFDKNDQDGKGPYYLTSFLLPKKFPRSSNINQKTYELLGVQETYRWTLDRAQKGVEDGILVKRGNGIYQKMYLEDRKGIQLDNVWIDIFPITKGSLEYTGYPTQKPRKLLRRLIQLTTTERDLILDPFCGAGTTCVESQALGRKYIGIDINPKAISFIKNRLENELGLFNNSETEPVIITVPQGML